LDKEERNALVRAMFETSKEFGFVEKHPTPKCMSYKPDIVAADYKLLTRQLNENGSYKPVLVDLIGSGPYRDSFENARRYASLIGGRMVSGFRIALMGPGYYISRHFWNEQCEGVYVDTTGEWDSDDSSLYLMDLGEKFARVSYIAIRGKDQFAILPDLRGMKVL
jgi:hypothetical protein